MDPHHFLLTEGAASTNSLQIPFPKHMSLERRVINI